MFKYTVLFLFYILPISIIAQHEITVTSASIQRLYKNCANLIRIDVPDLCDQYNPICKADNAEVRQSEEHNRKFCITPKGNACTLTIYNQNEKGEEEIGELKYNVIDPPKPKIELWVNGNIASANTAISKGTRVQIRIIPNPDFFLTMPNDAYYEIGRITIYRQSIPVACGRIDLSGKDALKGVEFTLPAQVYEVSSGYRIFIEINDIYRINYKGEKIADTRFTLYEKSLSVITR